MEELQRYEETKIRIVVAIVDGCVGRKRSEVSKKYSGSKVN
jgi:hypothetical protein